MRELWVIHSGLVGYEAAREAQARLAEARVAGTVPDLLLLLEHPPVYTRGRRSGPEELPMGEDWYRAQGIEVCDTNRGGAVTYHGPGQLVGYPIVSLNPYGDDVHEYLRRMERVIIDALARHGVRAGPIGGLTGVWTAGAPPDGAGSGAKARKIASIGVHVSRGVTTHGFAVNVCNDLQPFEWIVPCGIQGCQMTSVARELGAVQRLGDFADTVAGSFADVYEREAVAVTAAELGEHVPDVEMLLAAAEAALR